MTTDKRAGRASRSSALALIFLFPAAAGTAGSPAQAPSSVARPTRNAVLVLHGKPQGGEITVWVKGRELKIRSTREDSAPRLAEKIAVAINADPDLRTYGVSARASGAEVTVAVDEYWLFLCIADPGLRAPPAPLNLRATKRAGNLVDLVWQVPEGGYDSVHLLRGTLPIGDELAGTATRFTDYLPTQESYTYYVFGVKGRTPSCATSVVVPSPP